MSAWDNLGFPAGTQLPTPTITGTTRIDVLNSELSRYTNPADVAAITREIGRVSSGQSGDMNAQGTTSASNSDQLSWVPQWLRDFSDRFNNIQDIGDSNPLKNPISNPDAVTGKTNPGEGGFFAKYGLSALSILVGVVLLFGAFMTYRR